MPTHLKDSSRDKEGFGHGEGYLYPHAYRDHWVTQQYLPDSLQGKLFYQPGDQGYERQIRDVVMRRREAQLAAMVEAGSAQTAEILTFSPSSQGREQWLRRVGSGFSQQLETVRQKLFDLAGRTATPSGARFERRHRAVGLGGTATDPRRRRLGRWPAKPRPLPPCRNRPPACPELERPTILSGALQDLPARLEEAGQPDLPIRRPSWGAMYSTRVEDKPAVARVVSSLLASGGCIVLAEAIPRQAQRLYDLVDTSTLDDDLRERIVAVEESIYQTADDPMVNWDANDLEDAFALAGLEVTLRVETDTRDSQITPAQLNRWFDPTSEGERKSYAGHLLSNQTLDEDELARYKALLAQALDKPLPWKTTIAFLRAERKAEHA